MDCCWQAKTSGVGEKPEGGPGDDGRVQLQQTFLDSGGIVAERCDAFWGSHAHDAQQLDSWRRCRCALVLPRAVT
jgi:hypothetical protein